MTTPNDPTMSHDSLDAAIAGYLMAVEAGDVPNRQEWLDRHPEHAGALHAFFADLDRMDRVASPLRLAGGLEATGASDANGHATPPTVRYFGDYELLEEIARGGMGVVYKARQVSLNRLVALKMILAGSFASSRDIQRFRMEAESAANLDHPHIVPIHEVGEHEGRQYYTMKFVEGSSLAAHPREEPRAEVAGLIDVARAVHHAHQRGLLHRDLKPSNVLVDARRTRLVTDFGLAKRLVGGERSITETGQVVGTPRYMAPEQAAGRKDLTVAADVYGLGVILYERLTGQTPFIGDDVLSLLRHARETEPPRPSSIRPGIDRDLETVVLKCLQKEPGRRYASAEALADDLANWLAGRPILARPVGQGERFRRWCRRNPAVAGLAASVILALVLGTVVSVFFALAERRGRIRAEHAEDEAVRTFAQSLARPLDPRGDEEKHRKLSEPESVALWELSRHQGDAIGRRFVDEATRDPLATRQLRARSEPAMVAAVGLDAGRRERASGMLRERLRDPGILPGGAAEIAFAALELEGAAGPAADELAGIVARALAGDHPKDLGAEWVSHLVEAAARLEPGVAARLLVAAIEAEVDAQGRLRLATALAELASWLESADSSRACGEAARFLSPALAREADADRRKTLAVALVAVAEQWEPDEAAETLAGALAQNSDNWARDVLASGLERIAAWMEPARAARICGQAARGLVDAWSREVDPQGPAAWGMQSDAATIAERWAPDQARRLAREVAEGLLNWLGKQTNARSFQAVAISLEEAADRMDPAEAARICGRAAVVIADELGRERDVETALWLADALERMARRLDPAEAARVCGPVARRLIPELERVPSSASFSFGYGPGLHWLSSLPGWIGAAEAARLLGAALERVGHPQIRHHVALGLASAADRLDAAEGTRVRRAAARVMIAALVPQTFAGNGQAIVEDLAPIAGGLEKGEAEAVWAEAARALHAEFERATRADSRSMLAHRLAEVWAHLDWAGVAPTRGRVARTLADALDRTIDGTDRGWLARGLVSVAGFTTYDGTFDALCTCVEQLGRDNTLATMLAARAALPVPGDAAPIYRQAALMVVAELGREKGEEPSEPGVERLLALVKWLGPGDGPRVFGRVARKLAGDVFGPGNPLAREKIRASLTSIVALMPPAEAAPILAAVLSRHPNDDGRGDLARVLTATLDRLDAAGAARASEELFGAVGRGGLDAVAAEWLRELDAGKAHAMAWDVARRICSEPGCDAACLSRILADDGPEQRARRAARMAKAGPGIEGMLEAAMILAAEPVPCRLTTQELVELLKMPTCHGQARRVVLDQLGHRYGRRFANHWAFVRFAEEQKLGLDFTSPPRRPERR